MHFLIESNKSAKPVKNLFIRISIKFLLAFIVVSFSNFLNAQSSGCFTFNDKYPNRINYKTIFPCGATKIVLTISQFNLSGGSLLKVYDGTDASGKPLHPGNGFTLGNSPTGPVIGYSGAMYLYFSSNGKNTDSVKVCWAAEADTLAPAANFDIQDTLYNGINYSIKNKSQNLTNAIDYVWTINPDYGEVGYKKDLDFVFKTNKTFDITLEVTKCSGKDKYTKSVVVITPDNKVAIDFKANNLQPLIAEVDTFSSLSFTNFKRPYKPNNFHWVFSPDKVSYMNGSSADSPKVYVKFNEKGKYKVTLEAWNTSSPIVTYNEVVKQDYITVKDPTNSISTNSEYLNSVAIYPNPSNGNFNICYNFDNAETIDIQIYNATGKIVYEVKNINGSNGIQNINLSNETFGLYTLRIKTKDTQIIKKISILR